MTDKDQRTEPERDRDSEEAGKTMKTNQVDPAERIQSHQEETDRLAVEEAKNEGMGSSPGIGNLPSSNNGQQCGRQSGWHVARSQVAPATQRDES